MLENVRILGLTMGEIEQKSHRKGPLGFNLLQLALQFGLIIALPLLALISLGLYLDKTYHTLPLFMILGIVLATLISTYALYRKITTIFNSLNDSSEKK